MIINYNSMASNALRQLNINSTQQAKSMAKLSSGLRINSAADDAAGLAISEKMKGQIRGLDQASRNAQDGQSMIQTAEGALSETTDILQRMKELATQAANGTLAESDRQNIQDEVNQLNDEIDRISTSTQFNTKNLLDGSFGVQLGTSGLKVGSDGVTNIDISGAKASTTYHLTKSSTVTNGVTLDDGNGNSQTVVLADGTAGTLNFDKLGVKISVNDTWSAAGLASSNAGTGTAGTVVTGSSAAVTLQIGANNSASEQMGIQIDKMDTSAGSLNTRSVDVTSVSGAQTAIDTINTAIQTVSAERSKLGAYENRLDHTINNLNTSSQNTSDAQSRIADVDMAQEMMNQSKASVLAQAAQAMLAQANQQPQQVLQLLRG
ncbi:flagellin N-terminal helical domain-containing protein [Heyndrickxia ginsengihumi]|uniref:flagellin N-terminal helical domain-containing protein n=1 Tax=Heyndrickxia ginsengihumi TaxID=363870 RepID=UPI00203A7C0A|nr:flagellin [Heyndrickxia ginsengihumi]MCM3024047.1 flagellin [Heyndrickxia ginsengihumi]